jgi:UDP-glucose 4-epimerase
MEFLLTGGAGYIATHTIVELTKAGHDVVVADNFMNSQPEALRRVEKIIGKEITVYKLDVCDKAKLRDVFSRHDLNGVIHFAGLKAVGESVGIPLSYYRNNIDSTLALCETMQEFGVNKLVFSSSATVYGIPDKMPLVEDMPTGATSPYGWTKFMIEQILRDVAFANKDWSVVLLRYFNPVGAHESGLIGEDPSGIPNNLMPVITQVACGKLPKLQVYGTDYPTRDGTTIRDYIHVMDLARGHVKAIEYAQRHTGTEAINLGTGNGYSILEILRAFQEVNGVQVPHQMAGRRPGDVPECYADPGKALALLNWKAEKTLEDMCRDAWRWQKNNPKGYAV